MGWSSVLQTSYTIQALSNEDRLLNYVGMQSLCSHVGIATDLSTAATYS